MFEEQTPIKLFIKTTKQVIKELEDIKEFQEAFQIANRYSWNKKELEYYNRVLMRQMDDALVEQRKDDLKKALSKASQEGMQEGMQKGMQKGIKQEKVEIAIKSLKQGLDLETIKIITGLTDTELDNITDTI